MRAELERQRASLPRYAWQTYRVAVVVSVLSMFVDDGNAHRGPVGSYTDLVVS